jgi:hypothetical protein
VHCRKQTVLYFYWGSSIVFVYAVWISITSHLLIKHIKYHQPCYLFVLFPEDVGWRFRAVYQTGKVEAGGVVHVQLTLAEDLGARF